MWLALYARDCRAWDILLASDVPPRTNPRGSCPASAGAGLVAFREATSRGHRARFAAALLKWRIFLEVGGR